MKLRSNGGSMTVDHKAAFEVYKHKVWYDDKAIANIIDLKNIIKQYRVTYDSDEETFVVHREIQNKPNMHFYMHESDLHIYDPENVANAFVTTVSGNKEGYTKRQIQRAEKAWSLYAILGYPSIQDHK